MWVRSLVVAAIACSARAEVVELTDDNWVSYMSQGNPWMIEFYAPWCGQCKKLAPVYELAADKLGERLVQLAIHNVAAGNEGPPPPAEVPRIGRVDCTVNRALAAKFRINAYPSMRTIKGWTQEQEVAQMLEYNGKLSDLDIPNFLFEFSQEHWRAPVDRVVALNDTSFNSFVDTNELTMVMFYDPQCQHCKLAAPDFLEASDQLHLSGIKIGKINAKSNTATAELFDVKSYPKYKIFRDGIVRDYTGGRDTDAIVRELEASKNSALIEITTRYDLERLTESSRHIILAVFETADAPYMMRYEDVCAHHRADFKCYYTSNLNAVSRYPDIVFDTVTVFRSKFLTSKHEARIITKKATGNGAMLTKWISDTAKTLVGERTDQESLTGVIGPSRLHYEMYRPMVVVYYDWDTRKDYYGESKALFENVADVASKWNGSVPYARRFIQRSKTGEHLRFAIGRSLEYRETLQRFRLDDSDHEYVAIMYADSISEYRQGDDQSLAEFVEAAVEGKMEKYDEEKNTNIGKPSRVAAEETKKREQAKKLKQKLKEEEAKTSGRVVDLDDANAQDVVKDDEVWLVEFYTTWCTHCADLKPVYEKTAKKLKPKSGKGKYQKQIRVGAVNCETGARKLCEKFGVTEFPTLVFFKKGLDGQFFEYQGKRTADLMVSHMKAFSKKSWADPRAAAVEGGDEAEDDGLFHV